jgi:hypothetical protein
MPPRCVTAALFAAAHNGFVARGARTNMEHSCAAVESARAGEAV